MSILSQLVKPQLSDVVCPDLYCGVLQFNNVVPVVPLQLKPQQKAVLNMTADAVILTQSDFSNGTYRITQPGYYKLGESITFNPNPNDDWRPRVDQAGQYPPGKYRLGFFAAITIETTNVTLDLGGHTLKQSPEHYLQQRFYAAVELADQPFVVGQGPAAFGPALGAAHNCLITNGTLGLSSHHGIHGNGNTNIVLTNLNIEHFEIAGIALNGAVDVVIQNVNVHDNTRQVPVKATYSAARFLLPFFNLVDLSTSIVLSGVTTSGTTLKTTLLAEMQTVFDEFTTGLPISSDLFANTTGGVADGAVYGIVFNQLGVVVNDFLAARVPGKGNENLQLHNVGVYNIMSEPVEVVALSSPITSTAYKKVQTGPVGDVFRVKDVVDGSDLYTGTSLSNAQLFLSPTFATITPAIRQWAASTSETLTAAMATEGLYFVGGGDSMAHVMKGNVGVFLSGVLNFSAVSLMVSDVSNEGGLSAYVGNDYVYRGGNATGLAVVASTGVAFKTSVVERVRSKSVIGYGVQFVNMEATQPIPGLVVKAVSGGNDIMNVAPVSSSNPPATGVWYGKT